ncbi:MAG: hypothetical protein KC609_04490, partial [Myxococcales bacterium]|nr:hypothetical protein [Myxococcales bacterium]
GDGDSFRTSIISDPSSHAPISGGGVTRSVTGDRGGLAWIGEATLVVATNKSSAIRVEARDAYRDIGPPV